MRSRISCLGNRKTSEVQLTAGARTKDVLVAALFPSTLVPREKAGAEALDLDATAWR